jgi:hypothetical protein
MIYCHLTGQPVPRASPAGKDLYYWYPLRDFLGFLELHRRSELGILGWLKSVAKFGHVFPLVSLADPVPMFGAAFAIAQRLIG